jgi:hypothetical protein
MHPSRAYRVSNWSVALGCLPGCLPLYSQRNMQACHGQPCPCPLAGACGLEDHVHGAGLARCALRLGGGRIPAHEEGVRRGRGGDGEGGVCRGRGVVGMEREGCGASSQQARALAARQSALCAMCELPCTRAPEADPYIGPEVGSLLGVGGEELRGMEWWRLRDAGRALCRPLSGPRWPPPRRCQTLCAVL